MAYPTNLQVCLRKNKDLKAKTMMMKFKKNESLDRFKIELNLYQ
jgi:hypothetical protein